MINNNDITVVVQGPVIGKHTDSNQYRHTFLSLKSIRKYLPGSKIILSTWKNQDLTGLDFDQVIENDDPGNTQMIFNNQKFGFNVNRQILSTKEGLLKSRTKYSLKFRSDLVLQGNTFKNYFFSYRNRSSDFRFLDKRVLFCDISSFSHYKSNKRLFNPSDWFCFGLTSDLIHIWDIPLIDKKSLESQNLDGSFNQEFNLSAEQYIWTSFIKKFLSLNFPTIHTFNEKLLTLSNHIFANNLLFLESNMIKLNSLKYDTKSKLIRSLKLSSYYSFNDWKRLYNQFCSGHFLVLPNLKYLLSRFKNFIFNRIQ
jgi:hypothetical protein